MYWYGLLEIQIILFGKAKSCMLSKSSRIEPVQDIAISSLLEIDLKEQDNLNIWEQKTSRHPNNKRRTYSFHKPQASKHHSNPKYHPELIEPPYTRSDFDQQLMRLSCEDSRQNPQQLKNKELMSRSSQFNEGEYWMSKVNWMSQPQKKEHSSQPKLNKKLSFGFESSNRKEGRNNMRYLNEEKTREKQYKNHLIYSLFTSSDKAKARGQRMSPKNIEQSQPNFPIKPALKKISSKQTKDANKLNSQVQQYMRETLKRIYQKNRSQQNSLQQKAPEYERSSMIRELLINLENVKDHANQTGEVPVSAKENKEETVHKLQRINGKGMQEIIVNPQVPQRKFYHHLNQRHVLNLNLEAQKEYKSRSINQWSMKKQQLTKI